MKAYRGEAIHPDVRARKVVALLESKTALDPLFLNTLFFKMHSYYHLFWELEHETDHSHFHSLMTYLQPFYRTQSRSSLHLEGDGLLPDPHQTKCLQGRTAAVPPKLPASRTGSVHPKGVSPSLYFLYGAEFNLFQALIYMGLLDIPRPAWFLWTCGSAQKFTPC